MGLEGQRDTEDSVPRNGALKVNREQKLTDPKSSRAGGNDSKVQLQQGMKTSSQQETQRTARETLTTCRPNSQKDHGRLRRNAARRQNNTLKAPDRSI